MSNLNEINLIFVFDIGYDIKECALLYSNILS